MSSVLNLKILMLGFLIVFCMSFGGPLVFFRAESPRAFFFSSSNLYSLKMFKKADNNNALMIQGQITFCPRNLLYYIELTL